jgi:hypothetical protein
MSTPSSISRRMRDAIHAHGRGDYEGALVHFFPALDKAAKRRRPKVGVGQRIRGFLADEEGLISALATGNCFRSISVDGVSFPDAIYRFGRTSIAHEGELDPRLKISSDGSLRIGQVWSLPPSYITAMCIAVMAAPECGMEKIDGDAEVDLLGSRWKLNDLWGAHERIKAHVAAVFRDPHLFEP